MKTPNRNSLTGRRPFARQHRKAMALVIVLSSLVFLAALVVAFMGSVNTEMRTSKQYADSVNSDLLSQTAFNLAISQITDATRGYEDSERVRFSTPPPETETLAWASQPGMIRTYGIDGQPHEYFRLYSWDTMKGAGVFNAASDENALSGWSANTAHFTDLNEPITVNGTQQYPILNPSASGNVVGFDVSGTPTGGSTNAVPMPVKWLYILASGKVVSPTGSGKNAVINGATAADPIVGRFAFWTDDDTSKVNINTASDGTYWDTPRTSSNFDGMDLAVKQPAQKEFQRYPGHPAMTSLKTVFPNLTQEEIYEIIPRVTGGPGSSMGGSTQGSQVLTTDRDRLYASTDELIFRPALSGVERSLNAPTFLTRDTLERTKFFMTANNRAPELNLFNKPRVAIWPIHVRRGQAPDGAPYRTPFDELIAFCSTMRADLDFDEQYKFYIQREEPLSSTHDLPAVATRSGLGRNRMLINYLRDLAGKPIPGFGDSFVGKYGPNSNQIITQIFDYVRSVNTIDRSGPHPFTTDIDSGTGKPIWRAGAGQVVPIEDGDTRGFGRFPTLQGVTMLFFGRDDNTTNNTIPADQIEVQCVIIPQMFDPSMGFPYVWPRYRVEFQDLETLRWGGVDPDTGADVGVTQIFPLSANAIQGHSAVSWGASPMWGNICYGGSIGGMDLGAHKGTYPYISNVIRMKNPVVSGTDVAPRPTFPFTGGTVTFRILDLNNNPLQTIKVEIPTSVFPVPKLAPLVGSRFTFRRWMGSHAGRDARNKATNTSTEAAWVKQQDVVRSIVPAGGDMRMIAGRKEIPAPPANDATLAQTYYAPHSKYHDVNEPWAHNLRISNNSPYYMATGARLLPLNYNNYAAQYTSGLNDMNNKFPRDATTVPDTLSATGVALGKATAAAMGDMVGDWDNGVSFGPDGPYIGKPDEGDNAPTPYFYWSNSQIGASLFSPNRMVPSAGVFGSLPTGVIGNTPWKTLQFRPAPAAHPGLVSPKDHLWMDLFHMPVVEPYAISEPLSSAGRINMNYQIMPFRYIKRETGIRAVLSSERVIAIPDGDAGVYKAYLNRSATNNNYRQTVNVDETLTGFENRFNNNDIFRSASEICDVHIVPLDGGATYETMDNYWTSRRLTGDNSRERVYTTLYPRLTTKSNTFTIHVRAQSIQKRKTGTSTAWDQWEEGKDAITSEYRGYQTVERYVDPNNTEIEDYAEINTARLPISDFYKIRVLTAKQFAP